MSRPATLLVREVDFLMIYSHPIASDLPEAQKQPLTRQNDFAHRPGSEIGSGLTRPVPPSVSQHRRDGILREAPAQQE